MRDPLLIVEDRSCELVAEWLGRDVEHGQLITVTEMDTRDNIVTCRVVDLSDDVIRVDIIQGRLIEIDVDTDDWPFSGQPPGYFDEPVEPGPVIR